MILSELKKFVRFYQNLSLFFVVLFASNLGLAATPYTQVSVIENAVEFQVIQIKLEELGFDSEAVLSASTLFDQKDKSEGIIIYITKNLFSERGKKKVVRGFMATFEQKWESANNYLRNINRMTGLNSQTSLELRNFVLTSMERELNRGSEVHEGPWTNFKVKVTKPILFFDSLSLNGT